MRRCPFLYTAEFWNRRSTVGDIARQWVWGAGQALRWAAAPVIGLAVLQLLVGLGPAASVRITQRVIDLAIASAGHGAAGVAPLVPWLGALAVTLILSQGPMHYLRGPLDQRIDQLLQFRLERARLAKAARLPLLFFEASESYDRLSRSGGPGHKVRSLFASGADPDLTTYVARRGPERVRTTQRAEEDARRS